MYLGLHVECLIFLCDSYQTRMITTDFLKYSPCKISQKSIQWEPSWQTDRHEEANNHFWNFANAPETKPVRNDV